MILALTPGIAAAAFGDSPEVGAARVQAKAIAAQAQSSLQAAWIYGAAIVLAGVAVGAGVYFAARSRRAG